MFFIEIIRIFLKRSEAPAFRELDSWDRGGVTGRSEGGV
jgi:hypothetical protein